MTTSGRVLRLAVAVLVLAGLGVGSARAAGWSSVKLLSKSNLVVVGTEAAVNAYDLQTGALKWTYRIEKAADASITERGDAVIIVYQTRMAVAKLKDAKRNPSLHVESLDSASGQVRWRHVTSGTLQGSPLVKDRIFISFDTKNASANGPSPGPHLEALDGDSGTLAWIVDEDVQAKKLDGAQLLVIAPVPAPAGAKPDEKSPPSVELHALDTASGATKWKSGPMPGELKSGPDARDGVVVVSTKSADAGGGSTVRIFGFNAADGGKAYGLEFPDKSFDEAAAYGQYLFVRSDEGRKLNVYDAKSGTQLWSKQPSQATGAKAACLFTTIDGGVLYTVAIAPPDAFTVLAYDAANGTELGHADGQGRPESAINILGDKVITSAQKPGPKPAPDAKPDAKKDDKKEEGAHVLLCFAARTLQPLWTYELKEALGETGLDLAETQPPLVVLHDESSLTALDAASGKPAWAATDVRTGKPTDSARLDDTQIETNVIVTSTAIVFGDKDGILHFLDVRSAMDERGLLKDRSVKTRPWFDPTKLNNLICMIAIILLISYYIAHAKKGRELFIRRVAGLNAVDEAVGRATEMGKPVLYVTGLGDVNDIQTLASLSILSHVARRSAEYETPLLVPSPYSIVMSMAQEVVKEAHIKVGRPDSYNQDNIRYLTDDQFGYAAGVDGIMLRDRPAANFYLGKFYGESLILAETGYSTGAIQIAGTAETAQLPFFVAACDYTLLGEELYAASAYLSRDPLEVGSLKGQDVAKIVIVVVIVVSCLVYPWFPEVKTWLAQ